MLETLKTGDLCYYDSMNGLIPALVLSITGRSGRCGSDQTVRLKLTAARAGYKRGEVLEVWGLHAVPRKAVRRNNYQARIRPYNVQCDAEQNQGEE